MDLFNFITRVGDFHSLVCMGLGCNTVVGVMERSDSGHRQTRRVKK